ncbi:MAG: antitoxin [Candidatus Altiarchaeales archaeon ex4484_2]|nr:MAG: antitoxin [Candidatus Altiarchaeales archaeon ex4484_2]
MEEQLRNRIVVNPGVMAGKPVIKGTRIPVDAIIHRIADGMSIDEIVEDYPNLKKEDVKAALEYSADLVRGEYTISATA